MLKSILSVVLFVSLVAGCVTAAGVAQSPNARPGHDLIPPSFAGNFFTEICLSTAPSFDNVPQAISGEPFVQDQVTGTYFHKYADLSIKVSDYGCSLVFQSELGIDETIAELAKGVRMNSENWGVEIPWNIDITSIPSPLGNGRYYRIGLPRP